MGDISKIRSCMFDIVTKNSGESAESRFAHADDSVLPKPTRAWESAFASATAYVPARDSTHPL